MSEIEYFRFEVEPWRFGPNDPRHDEWRVRVTANGMEHGYSQVMPRIPFNRAAIEVYLRAAVEAFAKAGDS
jgi:hypothetical protein